jgi:hypothetical protein
MKPPTEQDPTIGIVYPLFQEHLQRFFDKGKTVFVKFLLGRPTRLNPGLRLFFYQSKSRKEIVGEARIVDISSITADEVLSAYGDRLFLNSEEFREYVGDRHSKPMLVLILEGFERYSSPLKLDKSVTMAGQYMTKTMLDKAKSAR